MHSPMTPWQHAFSALEAEICHLPRWVNVARYINEAGDLYGDQEQIEALSLALDEMYEAACKLRDKYQRLWDEARAGKLSPEFSNDVVEESAADLDMAASG